MADEKKPLTELEFIAEKERRRSAGLKLKGDTFTRREEIKKHGGLWDSVDKLWLLPNIQEILLLGGVPRDGYFELVKPEAEVKP